MGLEGWQRRLRFAAMAQSAGWWRTEWVVPEAGASADTGKGGGGRRAAAVVGWCSGVCRRGEEEARGGRRTVVKGGSFAATGSGERAPLSAPGMIILNMVESRAGQRNRRAGVYRIGSFFPSLRWRLPSVVVGEARLCRGVVLCGMVFLAASARRWRWRRRGIKSPSFFLAPVRLCSSLTGEVGEIRFGA